MGRSSRIVTNGDGKKHRYTVFFEPQIGGTYNVVFPAIPEIVTFGRTLEEARRMAADALKCHLEGLIQDGAVLPKEKSLRGKLREEELVMTL